MSSKNGLLKGALLGDIKVDGSLLEIRPSSAALIFSDEPIALTLR